VIDVVVPVTLEDGVFVPAPVPGAPSAGEMIQRTEPRARVVSGFKNIPAAQLVDLDAPLAGDVVLCGDDPAARAAMATLVERLPGLRAIDAGPLRNVRALEAVTPLLLNLKGRRGRRRPPPRGRAPYPLARRSRSRSSTRRILPLTVFGSASTNSIARGYL
jgi:predicted dinucleotide-binding enzyme